MNHLHYKYEYIIYNPIDVESVFADEKRFIKKYIIAPNIGFQFKTDKLGISVGVEPNLDISYKTDITSGTSPT